MVTLATVSIELPLAEAQELHTYFCNMQLRAKDELRKPLENDHREFLESRVALFDRVATQLAEKLLRAPQPVGPPIVAEAALDHPITYEDAGECPGR